MSEPPRRPRRPERPGSRLGRDDDAMTFDMRRGRRPQGDETARAIPTGRRKRPASEGAEGRASGDGRSSRPRRAPGSEKHEQPRTRVMPVTSDAGPPPRRPTRGPEDAGRPPRQAASRPAWRDDDPPPRDPRPPRTGRRRRPLRTALVVLLVLVLAWTGATIWAVNSAWNQVNRVDATPEGDRPDSDGRNVLLVGSDSREGLSRKERNRLGTGQDTGGARTDSILVLHTGGDKPTLLSIPRDSYVEIPGHGMNKINAAFSLGGPKLLAQTIEHNTGLRMDGYTEIGFGGFANVVDAVDGVWICVKNDMDDEKAHINLKKGCQTLDGKNALGYVRARYSDPEGDLGRAKRQRQLLGALMGKMATPGTMLQPWKVNSVGGKAASNITVGEDDSMIGTGRAFWAMRSIANGDGNSVTVPVSNNNLPTPVGSAVEWDPVRSKELFEALRTNEPLSIAPDDAS